MMKISRRQPRPCEAPKVEKPVEEQPKAKKVDKKCVK